MKLLQALADWKARREALNYDPRQERRQIGESIASMLVEHGYQIRTFQHSVDGPLGGESTRLRAVQTLADGTTQGFDINVYARGVFCADNERVQALIRGT